MSNLAVRVAVSVVAVPLIVAVVMAGGLWFLGFVLLLSSLALHEYYALTVKAGFAPQKWAGMIAGAVVVATFYHAKIQMAVLETFHSHGIAVPFPTMAQAFLILSLVFVPLVLCVELFRNTPHAIANIAVTVSGVAYVSLFGGSLVGLRELYIPADFPVSQFFPVVGPNIPDDVVATVYRWGGSTVLSVFVSLWVCDSAAYFVGSAWGRHRLFPRVSPKKSWEGAAAGFLGALAVWLVARAFVLPYMTLTSAIACGVITGVFGQIGDLVESLLKRDAGVKDSSALIPGHGGVLDRFDSLLFVAPLVFVYLDFIVF